MQNSELAREAKRMFGDRSVWLKYAWAALGSTIFGFAIFHVPSALRLAVTLWTLLPVVVSAYFGGFGPGLLATVIGIWSFEAYSPYKPADASPYERWAVYLLIALSICVLNEFLHRARRRIEASELLRSVTLSSIGDAVVTTDKKGRVTFMNHAAEWLSGWNFDAVQGRDFSETFPVFSAEPNSKARDITVEPLRGGDTVHLYENFYLRTRSGRLVPIEANAAPIRSANEGTHGVVLTLRDCTERRRAEEAMRERVALQERLSAMAKMLPGALHVLRFKADGTASLPYASPYFEEVYGFDPAVLTGDATQLKETVYPPDRKRVDSAVERSVATLQPLHLEYRVIHPRKGVIWIELYAVPTRDPDGSTSVSGILFDVTKRKRVEEQLRASQLQLRAALDAGGMGILQIDLVSGAAELDDGAKKLWGIMQAQPAVESVSTLMDSVHPDDRQRFRDEYQTAVTRQENFRTEFRVLHGDTVHWLAFHARIDQSSAGQMSRLMALVHDITFRRNAEDLRLRSQKLEALGVLAGGIAHDFNNLLLAIAGNVKLARMDLPLDHPVQVSLQEVSKASTRATALVRQILTFSQPQDQKHELLELRPVLEEVLSFARAILPSTIALHTHLSGETPLVTADPGQVHQAVLNLLTNAADAVPSTAGQIEVRLDAVEIDRESPASAVDLQPGRYVRIAVIDNGSGIDPTTLQRIFDPFFTTKQKGQGTGLGLAIVHGIMKGNGGAIAVRSAPGGGSVFELYFPAADGHANAQPSLELEGTAHAARILYVDDEEPLVFLMTRSLQRTQHFVEGFTDPREALTAFRSRPDDFDLVVSDMTMPGLSGFELARAILEIRPNVPVVITSGYLRPEDHVRARQLGVRELILKPNTVDELSRVVARCVGMRNTASTASPPDRSRASQS